METSFVKMLEPFKEYKKGDSYEIDSATAEKWLAAGIAEKADAPNIDAKLAKLEKAIEERDAKLLETITKAVAAPVKVPAVAKDNSDKSFNDFLRNVAAGNKELLAKKYGASYEGQKAQNTLSGPAGGYLVPTEYANKLIEVSPFEAIVRPRATVWPMKSNTLKVPGVTQTTNMYGGVVLYYKEEGAALTQTSIAYREIELHARDLTGLIHVTNDQLEDSSFDMSQQVMNKFRLAVAGREDKEFLTGAGIIGPLGIKNSGAALTVTRTTANNIKWEDIVAMEAKLLPESHARAVWVFAQSARGQVANLKDGAGNLVYLETGREGGFPMLRGKPVLFSDKLPALGSLGDAMLADFSYYYVGNRSDLVISFSEHYSFANNETVFRCVHRHDGQNALESAVLCDDGSTQLSNIVMIAA